MSSKNSPVPKMRFPEFRDAGEWEETTLVKLARFRRGCFPQPYGLPKWYDKINGMPFIQVFDVSDDLRLKSKTKNKISKLATRQSVFVPRETVIITIQGSIGRVAITQYDAYIDRTLLLFEKFLKPIEKIFFAYALQLLFEIEKQKAPGGIIKTITKSVLSEFKIKIPPFDEQQKIADCLSSIDDLITAEVQKLDSLKTHKKGLMQQLFPAEGKTQPQQRFPEFRDAGAWESTHLNSLANPVKNKADGGAGEEVLTLSGELGLVPQYEYFGKKVAGANPTRYIKVLRGDFVYNDRTTKRSTYGSIKRLAGYDGGVVSPIYKCFRFNNGEISEFWNRYFEARAHEAQIGGLVNEGARAGRFNISIDKFLSIQVWGPSRLEQKRIAESLSPINDLITAQGGKLDSLKAHKKGLMQQLFPSSNEIGA